MGQKWTATLKVEFEMQDGQRECTTRSGSSVSAKHGNGAYQRAHQAGLSQGRDFRARARRYSRRTVIQKGKKYRRRYFFANQQPSSAKTSGHQRGVAQALGVTLTFSGQDLAGNSSVASVVWRKARSIIGSTNNRYCLGIEATVARNKLRDLSHPNTLGALRDGEIF